MSFSRGTGVINEETNELGIIGNPEPLNGSVEVIYNNGETKLSPISTLKEVPVDANSRHILINNIILYSIKGSTHASIGQGVVKTIKQGKCSAFGGPIVFKIGILEDSTGRIKSYQWPKSCIVVDKPVLK